MHLSYSSFLILDVVATYKKDVAKKLPKNNAQKHFVKLTKEQREKYIQFVLIFTKFAIIVIFLYIIMITTNTQTLQNKKCGV